MENLEKYIKDHREALDEIEEPQIGIIWQGIRQDSSINARSIHSRRRIWTWAAAASILLLIGFGTGKFFGEQSNSEPLYSLKDISPELAEQEATFNQLIAQKEAEIGLQNLEKEAFKDIFLELELLEEIHKEFRKDIPQFSQNDQLVRTLIRYYEQKIRILERLSNEIEKHKNHEKRI